MANKRALIVDDSITAQYRLKKMLKIYALDIDVADSGEAALRYLAHNLPDVVFMDHSMPGMDGLRALQVIKSHPETAIIPVIMYTSQSGDVYTGHARALGALDVVSKDTINATDLSKVMKAIHIYPLDQQQKPDTPVSDKKTITVDNVTKINTHKIESPASNAATAEQARNLELRLGHLEHTLEDNRRFITARVLRELQGLHQNLRKEFNSALQNQQLPTPTTPEVEAKPKSSNRSTGFKIVFILILLVIAFILSQISIQLSQNIEVQHVIGNQLQQAADKEERAVTIGNAKRNSAYIAKNDFLADIAWSFNQNAQLAYTQNTAPDLKPLLRLHELLNRISTTGFKGSALITISIGNFCNSIDNMGVVHLAKPETNINDCVLSNELYVIDKIMNDYFHEANLLFDNLKRDKKTTLNITINIQEGVESYPERNSALIAREWNHIAQNNHRVDLVLLPYSD